MGGDVSLLRAELRRRVLLQRGQLDAQQRLSMETALHRRLCTLPAIKPANVFLVYCAYRSEVGTSNLIDSLLGQSKVVCVPLCDPASVSMRAVRITNPRQDLAPGYKGILEPIPLLAETQSSPAASLDVIIIPGVAFDRRGYRLGYGGGYYDRFLALEAPQALRIGIAFQMQLVERLPEEPHDVPMDMLLTEQECLSWSRPASIVPPGH